MQKEFDGFYVGQHLMLAEFDENAEFVVDDIIAGGMGVCVKVINARTNKVFALKGIQKEFLQEERSVQRFKRELDIWFVAASCDGVVDTESVVMINGIPYMLAEWVCGGDLDGKLSQMSPFAKTKAFIEIVDALRLVHAQYGIIHRDLKPQNILVSNDGRPLVADWGLAKIYEDKIGEGDSEKQPVAPNLTMAGSQMGTVLYMSPEQFIDSSKVDFRSDIYALGCILHELETGQPPFLGRTLKEITHRHLYEAPPALGGFFRKTALGLEKVITRCLQKNPADRYQSYDELLEELVRRASKRAVTTYTKSAIRYDRVLPGSGYEHYLKPLLSDKSKASALLAGVRLSSIIEEANMLIASKRMDDAVKLLRPFICLENIISKDLKWHGGTDLLQTYAYALTLSGKFEEAERCYHSLGVFKEKPAVYYVNNAYLNLLTKRPKRMVELCLEGLQNFPNDKDLLGNISTGYMLLGDSDKAVPFAFKCAKIGSVDVNDCEQLNNALKMQTRLLRYTNLDSFRKNMINRWKAISKGMSLNPNWPALHFAFVEYVSEVDEHDGERISRMEFGNRIMVGETQHALVEMWVKNLKEIAWFSTKREVVSNSINLIGTRINDEKLKLKYKAAVRDAYYSLFLHFSVDNKMAYEWLLLKDNGKYRTPIEAAEILHKLGKREEAYKVILAECESLNWLANRVAVQLYLADREFKNAIDLAKKGINMMPAHREVWQTLATAYTKAGMEEESKEALSHAQACWTKEKAILSELQGLYRGLFNKLCNSYQ
ncbi:MAG: serine/threonine protein kinase [Kiritimatiellae bacterium]|nr:serine/threonine protein kinase [Kiritimatiellia bacterium]